MIAFDTINLNDTLLIHSKLCEDVNVFHTGNKSELSQRLEDHYAKLYAEEQKKNIPPSAQIDALIDETKDELFSFLKAIGFEGFYDKFTENGIKTINVLKLMKESHLEKLGMNMGETLSFIASVQDKSTDANEQAGVKKRDGDDQKTVELKAAYHAEVLNGLLTISLLQRKVIKSKLLIQLLANVTKKYGQYKFKIGTKTGAKGEYEWGIPKLSGSSDLPLIRITIAPVGVENKNKTKKDGGIKQSGGSNGRTAYDVERLSAVLNLFKISLKNCRFSLI